MTSKFTIYFQNPNCFKPIENCYIKIHLAYFNNSDILFKTVRHWKIDFLQLRLF